MRTAFGQRCADAYRADSGALALRFSLRILRDRHEILLSEKTNVYVVVDEAAQRIKIGHSKTPRSRVSTLGVGNSNPLELVVGVPGTVGLEKAIHELLAKSWVSGEWFQVTPFALVICEMLISLTDWERDSERSDLAFGPLEAVDVLCSEADRLIDHLLASSEGVAAA